MTTPVPRPPGPSLPQPPDLDGLLPEPEVLESLPVREHVALFEGLHARLVEQLDEPD